jgi:hypothetical protein
MTTHMRDFWHGQASVWAVVEFFDFFLAFSFSGYLGRSEMDAPLWSQLWRIHKSLENVIRQRGNKSTSLIGRERGTEHFGRYFFYFPY